MTEVDDGTLLYNKQFYIGMEDILLKCFWQNKLFDCNDAFIDYVGELNLCFTFNPGRELAKETIHQNPGNILLDFVLNTVLTRIVDYSVSI